MTSFTGAMETAMEHSDSESGDQLNLSESGSSLSGTPTRHKSRPNEHVRRVRRARKSASLHAADESEYEKSLSQLQHSASALSTNSHHINASPLRAAGSKPPPPASAPDKPPPPASPVPTTAAVALTTKSQLTSRMSSPNLVHNKDNNNNNSGGGGGNGGVNASGNNIGAASAASRLQAKSTGAPIHGSDKPSSTSPPLPLPTKVTSLQNAIGTFKRGSNRVRSMFGRSKSSAGAVEEDDDPPSNRDEASHSGPAAHTPGSNPASSASSPTSTLNPKRQSGTFSNLTDSADGDMMFRAAQAGDYEAVHFLLEECVDDAARKKLVASVNSRQQTALVLAATNGFDEICRMLIEVDHSLMSRADRTGWSALHYAASEKRISTAMLLVRKGHDPNIRNDEGSTPLHYAIRIGPRHQTEDLLDLLEDHGADLDAQTRHGETALHQAAFRGNFANAGWLHGARRHAELGRQARAHRAAQGGDARPQARRHGAARPRRRSQHQGEERTDGARRRRRVQA
jgi:hypothetical protein